MRIVTRTFRGRLGRRQPFDTVDQNAHAAASGAGLFRCRDPPGDVHGHFVGKRRGIDEIGARLGCHDAGDDRGSDDHQTAEKRVVAVAEGVVDQRGEGCDERHQRRLAGQGEVDENADRRRGPAATGSRGRRPAPARGWRQRRWRSGLPRRRRDQAARRRTRPDGGRDRALCGRVPRSSCRPSLIPEPPQPPSVSSSPSPASALAKVSRRPTVRTNTGWPGRESRSRRKYPSRSNWTGSSELSPATAGSSMASETTSSESGLSVGGEIRRVGRRLGEELVDQPHLGGNRVGRRHPVKRRLHLAAVGRRVAAAGLGIVGAAERGDGPVGILIDADATDEVGVAETHFVARRQAEELLRRVFHEVVALDPNLAAEGNRARTGRRVLRIVDRVERLALIFRDSSR